MSLNTAEVSFPRFESTVTTPGIFIMPRPTADGFKATQPRSKTSRTASSGKKETLNYFDKWFLEISWEPLSLSESLDGGSPGTGVEFGTMDSIRKLWEAHRDGSPFTLIRHEQLAGSYPDNSFQTIHPNRWTVRFQDRQQYQVELWENAKDLYLVTLLLEEALDV